MNKAIRHALSITLVSALSLGALAGCFEKKENRWASKETLKFTGTFENQYDDVLLEFSKAQVTIIRPNMENVTRDFDVKKKTVTIEMRNTLSEKREDIVMRIHGDSEVLTCALCAKYHLASVWQKKDFSPSPDN